MFLQFHFMAPEWGLARIGIGRDALNTPYRIIVSSEDRDRADLVQQIVALRLGTPMETLTRKARLSQSALRARRVSLYLAHVALGWSLERVGHAFGINRQTVGTACTRIEEARDEPHLNDLLDQLAGTIQALCETPPVTDLPEVA